MQLQFMVRFTKKKIFIKITAFSLKLIASHAVNQAPTHYQAAHYPTVSHYQAPHYQAPVSGEKS